MRTKGVPFILLFLVFAGTTGAANAYEMEYYTYNGFDPIVSSFQKIALIFGDNGYKALFFSIITMSIFFGGAAFYFRMAMGARGGGLSWTIPVITGVVLWMGLVLPKGTLHIYDPVLNRYQAVGSIPDGLVVLAGSLNVVEKGLVNIISTSGDPKGYQNAAGGIGFNTLLKATGIDLMPNDTYLDDSLKKFTIDCIFFELQRPGTSLSVNDITNNSVDFFAQYSQAVNPAVYTTYYQDSNNTCPAGPGNWKNGCTMTCTEAWARIQTDFGTPANFTKARNAACAAAGFNPQNAAEMQRCDDLINQYVLYTSGNAINIPSTTYLRQAYMAQNLNNILLSVNPDLAMTTLANRNAVVSNIGTGIMANEWLPIARAVVTSVALGLVPFLVLFIPTPLFGKAIGTIAGFFVWLTAWGVADALTHGIATDNAYKIFESVRANNLGFAAMMATPDTAMKTLSMFGMMRTFGIMLATVLSGMLVKFGGHALAMMAGNISGHIQAQGAKAAMDTQTPEGHANTTRQTWDVMPTETMANQYSWWAMNQSKSNLMSKRHGTGMALENTGNAYEVGYKGGVMGTERIKGEYGAYNGDRGKMRSTAEYHTGVNVSTVEHKKALGMTPEQEGRAGANQQFMRAGTYGNLDADTMASNAEFDQWKIHSGAAFVNEMRERGLSDHDVYKMWAANETLRYYDTVGRANALDGDAGRQAQISFNRTAADLGGARVDAMTARELGYSALEDYHKFVRGGSVLDKEHAEFLRSKGWNVEEGMAIRTGLNAATGSLEYLTGETQGKTYSSVLRDGMRIESGSGNEKIGGHSFSGHYEKAYAMDGSLLYGRYSGLVDGKEGHLTLDSKGKVAYAEGKGGWDFESRRISRTTIDSSTSIARGTHVAGESGVFVLDPKKFTATSMIEKGDASYAQWLSQGDRVTKSANATVFAAGWSQEVGAFISREGVKFDQAEAGASVSAGFQALGMGASMHDNLSTGSRDQSSFNILSAGMSAVVTHARETAPSRGLTEAEAIKHDVGVFHSAVMHEGLHTKPIRDPNRHMPMTDTQVQHLKQQSQNESSQYRGIPENPMTIRK